MDAAAELLFGQGGEPALDQVEPTGCSGREMEMEAGPLGQPVSNQLCLVGAVVVQDQMDVQFCGHVLLDGVEEGTKLGGTVTAVGLADNLAGFCIERGEEAGGAVALVVMGAAFDLAGHNVAVNALSPSKPIMTPGLSYYATNFSDTASADEFARAAVQLALVDPAVVTGRTIGHREVLDGSFRPFTVA